MASVLIIDDEPNIRKMVGALLGAEGYEVREAPDGRAGVGAARESEPDAVLLDLMMPGEMDGMQTLEKLRALHSDLPVIMMSGRAGLTDAVRATKLGAFNFLEKPLTPEGVLVALASALELRRARRETRALQRDLGLDSELVGGSAAMREVRALIERIAPTDSRVLVTGESGTGKELVAAAIHRGSARRDRPFVRVNCAAIPRDLVESEMFGHERGAFTGAAERRIGRFELAHTGSLLLDEVGDLGAEAQAKLLRAIESREIERLGGSQPIRVDVRIIAATNRDLSKLVASGAFREDLYYRLNVIPLSLPPLRDRPGDVRELVEHFSQLFTSKTGRPAPRWTEDALESMRRYHWPGNVRELANVVERLAILHPGEELGRDLVSPILSAPAVTHPSSAPLPGSPGADLSLNEALDDLERNMIRAALSSASGNVAEAARRLRTDRPNLYRRMKRLGINSGTGDNEVTQDA
jgi:two-component system, NtrC family, nitrogen regulation response regulator NtrX